MFRRIAFAALALVLCLTVSVAPGEQGHGRSAGGGQGARKPAAKQPNQPSGQKASGGQQGARGAGPSGATPPGGSWADRTHSGKQSAGQFGNQPEGSAAVSGAEGAAAGYAAVRGSFNDTNIYGQQWYGSHPDVWAASGWAAGAAWTPSTWNAVAVQCGYANTTPTSYNYGVNVTAENGNVIVAGQNVGTVEAFSQQAADLADSGAEATTADTDQWMPLGVFAMVRNEQQHPQLIVQLAINQQGILRGNYTDEVTEHTLPIQGAVDKNTQRAAWRVGHNQQAVMEAGLNDLTEAEAPALIHKSGKTDHWLLVRLEQPQQAASDGANAKQQ